MQPWLYVGSCLMYYDCYFKTEYCKSESDIARHGVERPCCPSSAVRPDRPALTKHGSCCVSRLHTHRNQLTRMPINNAVEWMFSNCLQNTSENFILKIANQPENTVGTIRWLHNTCVSSLFTIMQSIIILTLGYSCKNGSVLRTNLSLSQTHKLAPSAPLYTKFTVCGMRCRKVWYEMEEADFFKALVPLSRNYTRCDVPVLVPTDLRNLNTTCMKYLLTLIVHHCWTFFFFEMYTHNSWMKGTCSVFESFRL